MGGGLISSGGGDDRIVLTAGAALTELADSSGDDTIEVIGALSLADISLRRTSDGAHLAVLVDGKNQLTVLNADGVGAVENILINGTSYGLASLSQSINHTPVANVYSSKVETSFFGGYIGDGSASDSDGDILTYALEMVTGEFSDATWHVDPYSGAVSGDFTRMVEAGSAYSFVTLSASDGIETTASTLTIWWADRNQLPTSSAMANFPGSVDLTQPDYFQLATGNFGADIGMFYV